MLAEWDTTGCLTLWASTQGSFNTRSEVADVLEIPENRIRVIPVECGGGFGGKIPHVAFWRYGLVKGGGRRYAAARAA